MASIVPIAAALGLTCPQCGTQLEDRIGPFWCPACPREVSAFEFLDRVLTPSADVPACRDEDPAHVAALAACYPPEHVHPEDNDVA